MSPDNNVTSLDHFSPVFDRVVGFEAGYINDPSDPGGETKWGISKRSYPGKDIKGLTRDNAYNIYYLDFWLKIDGDTLPPAVAYQLFDFAFNSGVETAIRYFQRVLDVADDGYFGPVSHHAITITPEADMIFKLNAERLEYMTKLKNWPDAGKGWARRIAQNLRYGALDT